MDRRKFFAFFAAGAASIFAPKSFASTTQKSPVSWKAISRSMGKPWQSDIYEHAKPGYDYVIGIDVGEYFSKPSVPSAISAWCIGNKDEPMVQVAEIVGPGFGDGNDTILETAIAVGEKYGKYLPDGPLFSVEQICSSGDLLHHQLKMKGFSRFHKAVQYRPGLSKKPKEGWYSTAWSRPIMIDRFMEAYRNKSIIVNSGELRENIEFAKFDGKSLTTLSSKGYRMFHAAAIAVNSAPIWNVSNG